MSLQQSREWRVLSAEFPRASLLPCARRSAISVNVDHLYVIANRIVGNGRDADKVHA
jgi:hypothetical protein